MNLIQLIKMIKNTKTSLQTTKYSKVQNINANSLSSYALFHYLFKSLFIIMCTIGCMFQITTIIKLFFDYPAIVFVNVRTMQKLQLPGVTLCNNNRLMMSKLKYYDNKFDEKWVQVTNATDAAEHDIKLRQQSLIDEILRNMMNDLTVAEFMNFGHSSDDFIDPDFFRCASDKFHPTQLCKKYANVITTSQELGNCFTLFHRSRSDILQNIAIDSGLSQSPVRRGKFNEAVNIELSEEPFHPNEVLRLKVNFQESEYTTLNEPVVGHIIIHDSNEAPAVREKSFLLKPGYYYEFFISKETDLLLPSPYATDCVVHKATSYDGSEDVNEYLHHPLSRKNCIIGCMAQNTMDKCKCWPPELPFMKGNIKDSQENSMKWCDWDQEINIPNKPINQTWFEFCFTAHEDQCSAKCKYDCSIERYRVIKEERQWPATQRIEHSKKGEYLQQMRLCCAIVAVRYWSAEEVINQYQSKFEVAEFTSYIGGLLSMWIGFSLLGLYAALERVVVYINNYFTTHQNKTDIIPVTANISALPVFNTRMNYDENYRKKMLRQTWQRKAKVAAIIDRWTRSSHQFSQN